MQIVLSNSDTYFGVWSKGSRKYRWIFPDLQRDPLLTGLNSLTFLNRMSTTSQMLRLSAQIHKTHLLSFRGKGWHVIPSIVCSFQCSKLVKSSFLSLSHINGTQMHSSWDPPSGFHPVTFLPTISTLLAATHCLASGLLKAANFEQ